MSNNNGCGFWVVVGLGLILIPVTIVEALISFIGSRLTFAGRPRPAAR